MRSKQVEMKDRVALVTGGSRGIGRAICIALSDCCGHLWIHYNGNQEAARETERLCKEKNPSLQTYLYRADVASGEQVSEMFSEIDARCGRIDMLVNNAGITKDQLMIRMTEQQFEEVIAVNLNGSFYCARQAAMRMVRQRYGRIINISSYTGVHGNVGQTNYAASKAGVIGMTKSMAKELAGRNITVNVVAPGMIETDMTAVLSDEIKGAIESSIPQKRPGKPEEVAAAVRFFVSDAAGYYTGQVLCPDGGMGL